MKSWTQIEHVQERENKYISEEKELLFDLLYLFVKYTGSQYLCKI